MKSPNKKHEHLDEKELLTILKDIKSGKVTITLDEKASSEAVKRENGIYHFDASNKWKIGVFVDCGKFDYVDYIRHGGKKVDYNQLTRFYPKIIDYASQFRESKVAKKVWGIEARIYAQV